MNQKIISILLVLLLVYLLFAKSQTVEGLEPAKKKGGYGFFSVFSNIFSFGETGKDCLNVGEEFIFNVEGQEVDIGGPLKEIFDNMSNDNCVITIDKLVEYGFPQPFLNQILPGQTEITVDFIENEIKQNSIRSIEGMGNIGADRKKVPIPEQLPFLKEKLGPENRQIVNPYDWMIGSLCFLYCCFALGRESISRDQLPDHLSEWASTNYMIRMVYVAIPTKSIKGLFDVFSDKNETIPSFNAFLTNKIRKSNVKEFLDNELDAIITIINILRTILPASADNPPPEEVADDIDKMLNESVDRLFDDLGENNIIVMKDVVQKISEEQELRRREEEEDIQAQMDKVHVRKDGGKKWLAEDMREEEFALIRKILSTGTPTLDFLIMDRFGATDDDSQQPEIEEEEMNELLWMNYLLTTYLIENEYPIDDFGQVLREMKENGELNDVIRKITPEKDSDEWEYHRGLFLEFTNQTSGMGDDTGDFNNETFSPENMDPENQQCIPIVPTDSIRDSISKYNECDCMFKIEDNREEKDYCMNEKNIIMEKFSEQDINCLNKMATGTEQLNWCLFVCSMDGGTCDLNDPNCSESCESRNNLYTRDKTCIPNPVSLDQQLDYEFCAQFRTQSQCDNETTFDTNEGPVCHWGGIEEIGNEVPEALNGSCSGNNDTHTVFYCNQFITKYECDVAERLHNDYGGEHLLCNWIQN